MPNRLAHETSPYLLQHKDNPVEWYPWGEEAFARAQAEDKPIFLSIGYAACHWCHVMAHESFEDETTASILNEHFVCVKVDREERPDVDSVYMNAVQTMTGSGGWPMSVWLLPDGRPFYGGTYFPDSPRHGMPSFQQVLKRIADIYRDSRDELAKDANSLTKAISRHIALDRAEDDIPEPAIFEAMFQGIASQYDAVNGGFGGRPKFPPAMTLELLLRLHRRYGWKHALAMVMRTLDQMMHGGVYDQLGGGFHRYSVDARWLVPHFEKMLYDNALLLRVYLHAFQVTGEVRYRRVVEQIIDYVQREMTDPAGGFYSTQDADSEGHEGQYFVWSEEEIRAELPDDVNADAVLDYWGVTQGPNFEGKNILWIPDDPQIVAARHQIDVEILLKDVETARVILLGTRQQRVKPGLDDKILTCWNGLMINSLAQAARVLDRDDVREMAVRAAEFIVRGMYRDGRLLRSYRSKRARFPAYLEDNAFLAEGLLELYQTTFDLRWYKEAIRLTEAMIALFWDEGAGFFDSGSDHEKLITRPQDVTDNAIPSGTSAAVSVLVRMAILADRPDWRERAEAVMRSLASAMKAYPTAFSYLACQLDFALGQPHEIALVGEADSAEIRGMLDVIHRAYRPNQVVALTPNPEDGSVQVIPLLAGRELVEGRPAAYVCQNYVCRLPVNNPDDLRAQLGEGQDTVGESN